MVTAKKKIKQDEVIVDSRLVRVLETNQGRINVLSFPLGEVPWRGNGKGQGEAGEPLAWIQV